MNSICFVTTGDIKNIATAKRALGMARPLTALGWKVCILMEDTYENRHRVALECKDYAQVCYFPFASTWQEIKAKNLLIKKIDPDFLYICAFVTRNIVGIGHHSRKLVEHSELQSGISSIRGLRKIHAILNEYASILYADAIINASRYLQELYCKRCKSIGFHRKPCFYLPYAFSNHKLNNIESINREIPVHTLAEERKVLIYLGTITRNYGVFTLIEAIEKVKERHPEVMLFMLGYGRHYNEAKEYVETYGLQHWIELPGYVEEETIATYFRMAYAFVSPLNDTVQDWARCPSKLYLYLPYRKPIITCRIGEPYHVLGREGIYYEPSSSESLAQAIGRMLDSRKRMIDIDIAVHTWEYRTNEFSQWINQTFMK